MFLEYPTSLHNTFRNPKELSLASQETFLGQRDSWQGLKEGPVQFDLIFMEVAASNDEVGRRS